MVDLATKSLLHDKLRFLITVSGVAFAVTLVFVQVGLFLGLMDNASLTIEHLNADLWVTSHDTKNIDFAHTFPETHVKRVRAIPGVARADNLIVWFMNVSLPNGAVEGTEVYALEDFARWNFPWKIAGGNLEDFAGAVGAQLDGPRRARETEADMDHVVAGGQREHRRCAAIFLERAETALIRLRRIDAPVQPAGDLRQIGSVARSERELGLRRSCRPLRWRRCRV